MTDARRPHTNTATSHHPSPAMTTKTNGTMNRGMRGRTATQHRCHHLCCRRQHCCPPVPPRHDKHTTHQPPHKCPLHHRHHLQLNGTRPKQRVWAQCKFFFLSFVSLYKLTNMFSFCFLGGNMLITRDRHTPAPPHHHANPTQHRHVTAPHHPSQTMMTRGEMAGR
jgi:hypothetical protein